MVVPRLERYLSLFILFSILSTFLKLQSECIWNWILFFFFGLSLVFVVLFSKLVVWILILIVFHSWLKLTWIRKILFCCFFQLSFSIFQKFLHVVQCIQLSLIKWSFFAGKSKRFFVRMWLGRRKILQRIFLCDIIRHLLFILRLSWWIKWRLCCSTSLGIRTSLYRKFWSFVFLSNDFLLSELSLTNIISELDILAWLLVNEFLPLVSFCSVKFVNVRND